MKKIILLLTVLLVFSSFRFSFAEEINTKTVFSLVAVKMGVQIDKDIALPQIKYLAPEELMNEVAWVIVRDFEGWKSLEGKSQEEISKELKNLLAQAKEQGDYELVYDNGFYDPYTNIIYLAKGSSVLILVHEVVHFFQSKYQKKYPESNEAFKNISEVEQKEMSEMSQKLEEEAERIAEEVHKEFFSPKVLVKAP